MRSANLDITEPEIFDAAIKAGWVRSRRTVRMRRRAIKEEVNKKSGKSNDLLTYNDIPEWMKDNNYITHGYRPVSNSVKQSLQSIFNRIHNESINIHSHLWGAIFFLLALVAISTDTFHRKHPNYGWKDYLGFTIFILSAITVS